VLCVAAANLLLCSLHEPSHPALVFHLIKFYILYRIMSHDACKMLFPEIWVNSAAR